MSDHQVFRGNLRRGQNPQAPICAPWLHEPHALTFVAAPQRGPEVPSRSGEYGKSDIWCYSRSPCQKTRGTLKTRICATSCALRSTALLSPCPTTSSSARIARNSLTRFFPSSTRRKAKCSARIAAAKTSSSVGPSTLSHPKRAREASAQGGVYAFQQILFRLHSD